MNETTLSANALIILWAVLSAVSLAGIIAVLVWAVRTRQFSKQDDARYLPLRSGIPATDFGTTDRHR